MSRPPDFELHFTAIGTAELYTGIRQSGDKPVWTSDGDDDFGDVVQDDFLGDEHAEDILAYLIDEEIVEDDDTVDVIEHEVDDSGEEVERE